MSGDKVVSILDDLYVEILLALSDKQILEMSGDLTLEEFAKRFPEVYEQCVYSLRHGRSRHDGQVHDPNVSQH